MPRDLGAAPTAYGLLARAGVLNWPVVTLADYRRIGPGEARWREWAKTASLLDRILAWEQLPERPPETQAQPARPLVPTMSASDPVSDPHDGYHRVAMTDQEFTVMVEVLHHVQQLGLRLPPFHVEFTDEDLSPPGAQGLTFDRQRPVIILLRAGLSVRDLFRVACHELKHASDAGRGLSRAEGEQRASAFQVMATRRAGWST